MFVKILFRRGVRFDAMLSVPFAELRMFDELLSLVELRMFRGLLLQHLG